MSLWNVPYIRTVIALVFLAAGMAKLHRRKALEEIILDYRIVSPSIAPAIAILLPATEIVVGLLLLGDAFALEVRLVAALLFLIFATGMMVNLLRGRTSLACGCFGP